ncbi:MAG: hypothetical protein ACKVUT_00245 [Gaiella sp.]
MAPVPKTPIGLVFAAYKLWKRLPSNQRRQLLEAARKHGPAVAEKAAAAGKRAARTRR